MEKKALPKSFEIVLVDNQTYSFKAVHYTKYITYNLSTILIEHDKSEVFKLYNLYSKKFNQVPPEFKLGANKFFSSKDIFKKDQKMLIIYKINNTLDEYIKEITEFNDSNDKNLRKVKLNMKRVKNALLDKLKSISKLGYHYTKLNAKNVYGNHNLSEIYLYNFENLVPLNDKRGVSPNEIIKKIFV